MFWELKRQNEFPRFFPFSLCLRQFSLSTVKPLLSNLSWTSPFGKGSTFPAAQKQPLIIQLWAGRKPEVGRHSITRRWHQPSAHLCVYAPGARGAHRKASLPVGSADVKPSAAQPRTRHWPSLCKTKHRRAESRHYDILPGEPSKVPPISLLIFLYKTEKQKQHTL